MDKQRMVELVAKAKQRDKSAIAELFYNIKDSTYFVAGKMLGSVEGAEAIVENTAVTLLRKIDTLDMPEAFLSWIRMIASYEIVKKLGDNLRSELSAQLHPNTAVGNANAVQKEVFDNPQTKTMLMGLIDSLPADQKLCVYMFYYQRLAVENIAKVLGISKNAVSARLYEALNALETRSCTYEINGTRLTAVPAWLIASAIAEQGSKFAISREKSIALLNSAAKTAYAPAPAAAPAPAPAAPAATAVETVNEPAAVDSALEDEDDEDEVPVKLSRKEKRALKKRAKEEEEDDEDDDEYDDDDDEDDDAPGFFASIWGKILIIFLVLAVLATAAYFVLPMLLNKDNTADAPAEAQNAVSAAPELDNNTAEPAPAPVITQANLPGTYYGFVTTADGTTSAASDSMTVNADGTWSSGSASGSFTYDETSMKLVTTNDETGYPTEWNCWLDAESNIVLSQKVDAANSSDVYNYYPSE